MHLQTTVVVNEAELSEFVHEEVHSGAGGANHLRQSLLAQLWDDGFGLIFFSETGQDQKRSGQTFLAGIEKLIDQVFSNPDIAPHHVGDEAIRERVFRMEHADHFVQADHEQRDRCGCSGRCDAQRLPCQGALADKVAGLQHCDDGLLPDL